MKPTPVPGALEGVKALRHLGYKLVIVTARHGTEFERTLKTSLGRGEGVEDRLPQGKLLISAAD